VNLSAFSVRRPVLTAMVTLIAVLIGILSLSRLPVDLLPDIEYPYITVNVAYPNASPQAMEELVAKPIENAVATVQGVEEITASTAEGVANVQLKFAWGTTSASRPWTCVTRSTRNTRTRRRARSDRRSASSIPPMPPSC